MEIDLENEFWTNCNQPQPRLDGTIRKRLFPTPVPARSSKLQRTSTSPSFLTTSSITNQFFHNQNPPVTPQMVRDNVVSARRRPSVANIEGTPSVRKRLVCSNPDACHARQAADLTAWLNYELLHPLQPRSSSNGPGNFPQYNLSQDNDFLNQLSEMHRLFHSGELHGLRLRLVNDLREHPVNPNIDFATDVPSRRTVVSHILLNYHPAWLLPALCVMFETNLAVDLDAALYTARNTNPSAQDHFTLMQFLEDVLYTAFLSPHRHVFSDVLQDTSSNTTSPISPAVARKKFHRLILERILELVLLLDFSGTTPGLFIRADPPLFRHDSSVTSSKEFVSVMEKSLFETDMLQLFFRQYPLRYRMPRCEVRRELSISDLAQDLRDGIRLCKLAALFTNDKSILGQVRVPSPQKMQKEIHDIRLHNIQLAMRTLLRFAQKTTKEAVEWYASPMEVATGNLPTILPFLWQLVAMWRDSVLFSTSDLSAELETVKQKFRENRRKVARPSQSPTLEMSLNELSPSIQSPSNLCIYERCKNLNSSLLLEWSAVVCGTYGLVIRDFSASFRDGAALALMLHFYHPDIIRIEEIVHVAAAEVRAPEAAEAEMIIAQNNFDLFVNRLRILGAFPNLHISAESALGGSSLSSETQQSFGRLTDLILSYLFRYIVLQRDSSAQERIEMLMEESKNRVRREHASRLIAKSLKHLRVAKRLERMGSPAKAYNACQSMVSSTSTLSPVHGRGGSKISPFSRSGPPRISPSAGANVEVFGEPSRNANMFSSAKPPKHGGSKMSSFLSSPKKGDSISMKIATAFSPSKSPSSQLGRGIADSDPIRTIRRLRDDTARRMHAASVISNTYRAWKARQEIGKRKKSITYLQSCGRTYLARRDVHKMISEKHAVCNNDSAPFQDTAPYVANLSDPLVLMKVLSPANAGIQLAMDVLPRVQDHMKALERFISKMEEEEELSRCPKTTPQELEVAQPVQTIQIIPNRIPSPPRSESDSRPPQGTNNENAYRKTWSELAISAAAGGASFLAQTVFKSLSEITNHVDGTLHEGSARLYLSARKPSVEAVDGSNVPSENIDVARKGPPIETRRSRQILGAPLDSRNLNEDARYSDDHSFTGLDEICVAKDLSSHEMAQRCNEAVSLANEVSARKDQLNSDLAKVRREEVNDEVSHRHSISQIERQLSELSKTSEELTNQAKYVQRLSSQHGQGASLVRPLSNRNQSPHNSHESKNGVDEFKASLRVVAEKRLKARLADAEDAFATMLATSQERESRRMETVSNLENFDAMSKKIRHQVMNEFENLDKIADSADQECISSAAQMESKINTLEATCEKNLCKSEFATEWPSVALQPSIPDINDSQQSYSLIIAERLRERLSEAEDRFSDEYSERACLSLKYWLNWMGYVILLRELSESSRSDHLKFEKDMKMIDQSTSELEKRCEIMSVLDPHPDNETNAETDEIEDVYNDEAMALESPETSLQISYNDAIQSHTSLFKSVLDQRMEERLELAEETFQEEMDLRNVANTSDWCDRKERELDFLLAKENLTMEEKALLSSPEPFPSLLALPSDIWMCQPVDYSTNALCSFESDTPDASKQCLESIEASEELESEYICSVAEYNTIVDEIRKERIVELLVSAQENYDNFMLAQRLSTVENWLKRVESNVGDRELSIEIEEISSDREVVEEDEDLCGEIDNNSWEGAIGENSSSTSVAFRDVDAEDFDYTCSFNNIEATEHERLLQEAVQGTDAELKIVLSCRLTEALELASDRFDEELLQRRVSNLNSWLERKSREISVRELDAELAEEAKACEAEVHSLQEPRDSMQRMHVTGEVVLSAENVSKSHYDASEWSLLEFSPVVADDDPLHEAYHHSVKESELLHQELFEARMHERHSRAEQEFEEVMMSRRCASLIRWLKRAEDLLNIRELDEECIRVSSASVGGFQDVKDSHADSVYEEYGELPSVEDILLMREADENAGLQQKPGDGEGGIFDVLEEMEQMFKEIDTERNIEANWESADLDRSEIVSTPTVASAKDTIQKNPGPTRATCDNQSDLAAGNFVPAISAQTEVVEEICVGISGLDKHSQVEESIGETVFGSKTHKVTTMSHAQSNATRGNLSGSLSIFATREEKSSEDRDKNDNDDFVSLSSFATSKNSSQHSAGNDFVSLSSLRTSQFSPAMDTNASPNIFSSRHLETPYFHDRSISFGERTDHNISQWNDTISPNVALWRIGDTPLRNRDEVLERLSAELDAIGKDMSPNGINFIMNDIGSASRLQGVMRRISMATGSPFVEEDRNIDREEGNPSPCVDLVRMVLIVMRTCIRSDEYIALVRLGMKIIKDLCVVQHCIRDVIEVEESVDVISTCVQFYRDDENIFKEGVEILHSMSRDDRGVTLLKESTDVVSRLERVKEVMAEQFKRSQRNKMRLRQANIVKSLLAQRKGGQRVVSSLAEEIRRMQDNDTTVKEELNEVVQKLGEVVESSR